MRWRRRTRRCASNRAARGDTPAGARAERPRTGLPQVDLAAFQHDGEREQRHEHQRDEECGHGLRDGVQREIQKGAIGGAKDQIMVAVVRVEAGEQALPQHVEAGRPQA